MVLSETSTKTPHPEQDLKFSAYWYNNQLSVVTYSYYDPAVIKNPLSGGFLLFEVAFDTALRSIHEVKHLLAHFASKICCYLYRTRHKLARKASIPLNLARCQYGGGRS